MFKGINRILKVRLMINFFSKLSASMLLPFMAIYYLNYFTVGTSSLLVLITTALQLISSLYGGFKTDNIGRKTMMVSGEFLKLSCIFFMIFQLSPIIMFTLFSGVCVSQGLINPAADAMLIDLSNSESRPKIFSVNYWITNLSIIIGTIIGGWMFEAYFSELLIFLFMLSCVTSLLTILKIEETFSPGKDIGQKHSTLESLLSIFRNYVNVLKNKRFLFFTLASILIVSVENQRSNYISLHFAQNVLTSSISVFGNRLELDGIRLFSVVSIINPIIIVTLTPFIIKVFNSERIKLFLFLGIMLFSFGYAGMAYFTLPIVLAGSMIIASLGELIYIPSSQTILAEVIDESKKGSYMAFSGINMQIGRMISALFIMLNGRVSPLIIAILIFISGILGLFFMVFTLRSNVIVKVTKKEKT
jgi:DHA1 family multidrug resistance protein B-like MFS transporter